MQHPTPIDFVPAVNCHDQGKADAERPHPNKKKIFVCCDGTGNEFMDRRVRPDGKPEDGNSNVVKLYTTLRITDRQVAYYHPGVGTMGDPTIRQPILRFWSKVKGLAFGAGFRDNVLDAYRYLMEVYNDGDEIYIFGFSRGSYTARALAGMLHGYGLLCRGNEGHLLYAWNLFHDAVKGVRNEWKKKGGQRQQRIAHNYAFAETFSRKVTIRFMGIWDTVSSVGWIYDPIRLLDVAQNPILQVGRHAVSLDERRAYYRDNLWGEPVDIHDPEWPEALRRQNIRQDIAQVWFPGVHSDVGGSYPQHEAAPANEALKWMICEVQRHGAELCEERVAMVLGEPSGMYSADAIYTPAPAQDHCLHESLKGLWWVLQCFPQQYYDKEDGVIQWRVPYGTPRKLPHGAILHGSAERRLRTTAEHEKPYRPRNFKQSELRALLPDEVAAFADWKTSQPNVDASAGVCDVASLQPYVNWTTADLRGCFVYKPSKVAPPQGVTKEVSRYGKLLLGWTAFGLFWGVVGTVVWYGFSASGVVVVFAFGAAKHTPGLRTIYRWGVWFCRR